MQNTVTVEEAKARLDDLLDRAYRGEEWVIVRMDGQPMATLTKPAIPPTGGDAGEIAKAHASLIGMMKGQIEIGPDFDEPLEDFKPYME